MMTVPLPLMASCTDASDGLMSLKIAVKTRLMSALISDRKMGSVLTNADRQRRESDRDNWPSG